MCILWRQISLAGRCFTGFIRERLYPPGTLKQTQITLTCLSSSLLSYRIQTFGEMAAHNIIPITSNDSDDNQSHVNIMLSMKMGLNVQILLWQWIPVEFQLLDIAFAKFFLFPWVQIQFSFFVSCRGCILIQ